MLRDIEDGRSTPSFEMVMRFLKAYTVDIGEFLRQTGYLPPNIEPERVRESKRLPVISWTQAGNWQEICDTSQYGEYVETDAKGIFALRVLNITHILLSMGGERFVAGCRDRHGCGVNVAPLLDVMPSMAVRGNVPRAFWMVTTSIYDPHVT